MNTTEINKNVFMKHELIRLHDKKKITTKEFNRKMLIIQDNINSNMKQLLKKPDERLELAAEIIHNIWIEWSRELADTENLSDERIKRWTSLWVKYDDLSEDMKKEDRKQALRIMTMNTDIDKKLLVR